MLTQICKNKYFNEEGRGNDNDLIVEKNGYRWYKLENNIKTRVSFCMTLHIFFLMHPILLLRVSVAIDAILSRMMKFYNAYF